MKIAMETPGIHHLALRVTDFDRARRFYTETLGFPVLFEQPNLLIFGAGQSAIAIRGPEDGRPAGEAFDPFRVGLDHLALACPNEAELARVAGLLGEAGVWNTGVKTDETLGRRYVAFKDPDRISWELYMA